MVEIGATKPYESAQVHQRLGMPRQGTGQGPSRRRLGPPSLATAVPGSLHHIWWCPQIPAADSGERYAILNRPWGGYQFGGRKLQVLVCGGYQLRPWQNSVDSFVTWQLFVAGLYYLPAGFIKYMQSKRDSCTLYIIAPHIYPDW